MGALCSGTDRGAVGLCRQLTGIESYWGLERLVGAVWCQRSD